MTDSIDRVDRIHDCITDIARIRAVATDNRARELREALKDALAGAPHWRYRAQRLLDEIWNGVLREPLP
jgi:hypothetical protein